MDGHNSKERAIRRQVATRPRLSRAGASDLGVVAALLVVAVLVTLASVGGPIWDVLITGRTLFH